MIYNNVILKARDSSDIDTLKALLTTQAQVSLTEQGCQRFEVYHSEAEPEIFLLVEWWETQEDLDSHRSTAHFVDVYRPQVIPLVERFPHPSKRLA
jgi:quinol monooxygenase YgiN